MGSLSRLKGILQVWVVPEDSAIDSAGHAATLVLFEYHKCLHTHTHTQTHKT